MFRPGCTPAPRSVRSVFHRLWLSLGLLLLAGSAAAAGLQAVSPADLRTKHAALAPQLSSNQFHGPLYLDSAESSRSSQGDVYAVVDHPFAVVSAALNSPEHWCDVMILHLNTKFCQRKTEGGATKIEMRVGRKYDQPVADAEMLLFTYRAVTVTSEYLDIELDAADGPYGTRDYRILLEADRKSVV